MTTPVSPETMNKLRRELTEPQNSSVGCQETVGQHGRRQCEQGGESPPASPPRKFGWEALFEYWTHFKTERKAG